MNEWIGRQRGTIARPARVPRACTCEPEFSTRRGSLRPPPDRGVNTLRPCCGPTAMRPAPAVRCGYIRQYTSSVPKNAAFSAPATSTTCFARHARQATCHWPIGSHRLLSVLRRFRAHRWLEPSTVCGNRMGHSYTGCGTATWRRVPARLAFPARQFASRRPGRAESALPRGRLVVRGPAVFGLDAAGASNGRAESGVGGKVRDPGLLFRARSLSKHQCRSRDGGAW